MDEAVHPNCHSFSYVFDNLRTALLLQAEFHYSGKKITFIYCGLALQLNDEDVIVIFEVHVVTASIIIFQKG